MDIVALDPGGTTGWSWWDDISGLTCGELGQGNRPHHTALEHRLFQIAGSIRPTSKLTVICESFDNRADPAAELVSLEYIGIVRLFCAKTNTRFIPQSPGNVKPWLKSNGVKYAKLRATGLWVPGQPHASDSNGHILYYLVNNWGHLEAVQPYMKMLREMMRDD